MKTAITSKIIILLLSIQIIVDCLHSVTAFPFLHYGMFSESYTSKYVQLFEVTVNGEILSANDFGILTWDLVQSPLVSFKKQMITNDFSFDKEIINKVFKTVYLEKVFLIVKDNLNNQEQLPNKFPLWYKTYLSKLLDCEIKTLEVTILNYNYQNNKYTLLKKTSWIKV